MDRRFQNRLVLAAGSAGTTSAEIEGITSGTATTSVFLRFFFFGVWLMMSAGATTNSSLPLTVDCFRFLSFFSLPFSFVLIFWCAFSVVALLTPAATKTGLA
jgi:hypothetical protein